MPLARARAQQVGVGRRRRAHEDEVDRAVGQVVDVGDGRRRRAPPRPRGWWRTRPPRSRWRGCCAAPTKPNLPGWVDAPATSTPRGSNSARNCSSVGRGRLGAGRCHGHAPSSTSASTATGRPSADDQRVEVDARARRVGRRRAGRGRRARRRAGRGRPPAHRGTRRAAPGWRGRRSSRRRRSASIGTGRNTTSATASARMPPTPSITVGPNCGSRTTPAISSRFPAIIGATSTDDGAVLGRGGAEQLGRGASTAIGGRRGAAAPGPARSCGRWRRRSAWPPPGSPSSSAASPRPSGRRPGVPAAIGTPNSAQQRLGVTLRQGRVRAGSGVRSRLGSPCGSHRTVTASPESGRPTPYSSSGEFENLVDHVSASDR